LRERDGGGGGGGCEAWRNHRRVAPKPRWSRRLRSHPTARGCAAGGRSSIQHTPWGTDESTEATRAPGDGRCVAGGDSGGVRGRPGDDSLRADRRAGSAAAAKARTIEHLLGIVPMDPRWTPPSRLRDNPLGWLIEFDVVVLDSRTLPREVQEKLVAAGLIPLLPRSVQRAPAAANRVPPQG